MRRANLCFSLPLFTFALATKQVSWQPINEESRINQGSEQLDCLLLPVLTIKQKAKSDADSSDLYHSSLIYTIPRLPSVEDNDSI